VGAPLPNRQILALGSISDPFTFDSLISIPYTIPGGRLHGTITQLQWLSPARLIYLGESMTSQRPCPTCALDTLRSGLDVAWLDVNGPGPTPHAVPGTDYASGVSPGAGEDEIYYTLGGDSRVYRQLLSGGGSTVVHDFGAQGIARDVHVVGNRMAAIVGGRVAFTIDPSLGPFQWDSGGTLHVVNLQDGSDLALNGPGLLEPGLLRHPRLSPDGTEVLAEVYSVATDPSGNPVVDRSGDLYLFQLP
jgi:hypothetical protein